jgi:hypothetical protein
MNIIHGVRGISDGAIVRKSSSVRSHIDGKNGLSRHGHFPVLNKLYTDRYVRVGISDQNLVKDGTQRLHVGRQIGGPVSVVARLEMAPNTVYSQHGIANLCRARNGKR